MADSKTEQLVSSEILLTKCPENKFANFVHSIIDEICGQKPGNVVEYNFWTLEEWWDVNNLVRNIITENVTQNEQRDLDIPRNYQLILKDCVTTRQPELQNAMTNLACKNDGLSLKDFDWKLKVVLASDKMGALFEPLLELDLDLQDPSNEIKTVTLEMSKNELKTLINNLENANKAFSPLIL